MIQKKIIKNWIPYSVNASNNGFKLLNRNYFYASIFKKISQENKEGADRRPGFRNRGLQNAQRKVVDSQNKNKTNQNDSGEQQSKDRKNWSQYLSDQLKQYRKQHLEKVDYINKVNQHFLGVKYNTKYKKFFNEASFQSIFKQKKIYRIDDLPFTYQARDATSSKEIQSKRNNGKRQQYLFQKVSEQKLKKKMLEMAIGFFRDLDKKQRSVKIEPNFEYFAHSVVKSLKDSSYQFQIIEQEVKQSVQIKDIYFIKGVVVNRNDNYSTDSYLVSNQKLQSQKLIQYILWKNEGQEYPERQWHALKNILVRFETVIQLPLFFDVAHPNRALADVGVSQHEFVFEMDLILPPKNSQFRLTQEEYNKSYRPNFKQLTITNVDNKNPFYALTFKENQKQSLLINKLI